MVTYVLLLKIDYHVAASLCVFRWFKTDTQEMRDKLKQAKRLLSKC
jgi:hypothetical protein